MMNKKIIELEKIYSLDMGNLEPVEVKTKNFTEKGVVCEYMNSWLGRTEEIGYELFDYNGFSKPIENDYRKIINKTNTTNQYDNIIELLKEALIFYANKNNYEKKHGSLHDKNILLSYVDLDLGNQANFALEKLNMFINFNKEMKINYEKELQNIIKIEDVKGEELLNNFENFIKIVETHKNWGKNKND